VATTDEIRRQRRIRHLQEQRRRAAIRRRNLLFCAAIASAIFGVVVGAGHGSGSRKGGVGSAGKTAKAPVKLRSGGVGPPPDTGDLVKTKAPVPILMYHVIDRPPAGAQLPQLFVAPGTFDHQMEALSHDGYTAVSLNQVYDAWFKGGLLPKKPVVVSFDDGYRGQYVYARPELRKLGWPGVLNLIVRTYTEPDGELTPQMVETMINDGWEIDSHTVHHLDVSQLSGAALREEVAGSRKDIQQRFHQPVNFFCYPSGRYNAQAIQAVRAAGYLGATTTKEGLASKGEMFTLKRIRVDGSDGVSGLEQKLRQAGA
jgi:peptidoglycan/xylan/chitin deacetylase (PgdA/CDA1 family)